MKIDLGNFRLSHSANIAIRCPHCGNFGTFENVGNDVSTIKIASVGVSTRHVIENVEHIIGVKKCPNVKCNGHVFFIADNDNNVLITHPSQTIPFDKVNIPERILNAFEESVICYSNSCFIASAIMIRETLEEICIDKGAVGSNLFFKLENLCSLITIPKELLTGMQELRLLGNDAAHIEAKTFNEIGNVEIEVSIEFTKEILKAVYQYESLLKRLNDLKIRS